MTNEACSESALVALATPEGTISSVLLMAECINMTSSRFPFVFQRLKEERLGDRKGRFR